ncbi:CPBP family intramembrane glutamic endopeptidase [Rurimicrobium arvi]|uniref:Type II CAAX endopeptidase family protein n=1 Tax=Rurimicrobium arvi TaxID=2049916 RepID=A0ABP8MI78_9BACT
MSRQLWIFVIIAYAITWPIVFGLYFLYTQNRISLDQLNILYCFGSAGPFLAAIITSAVCYKNAGVRALLDTLRPGLINKKAFYLSLTPLCLFVLGYLLYPLFTGTSFSFGTTKSQFSLSTPESYVGWGLPFVSYALLEELGWRGFALPHLQTRYSALTSSVLLTLVWGLWHLPFFLWRFQFSVGMISGFFFGLFVGTIILTAIFNISRGSVLAAIIFHLTNNIASAFDKQYIVAVISTGFVLIAAYLLMKYKPVNLADVERSSFHLKTNRLVANRNTINTT